MSDVEAGLEKGPFFNGRLPSYQPVNSGDRRFAATKKPPDHPSWKNPGFGRPGGWG